MQIIAQNLKIINGTGSLKAFIDLTFAGGFRISGFRIIQQPGQRAWLCMPQQEWFDHEGKKHYKPLVQLPSGLRDEAEEVALEAWNGCRK